MFLFFPMATAFLFGCISAILTVKKCGLANGGHSVLIISVGNAFVFALYIWIVYGYFDHPILLSTSWFMVVWLMQTALSILPAILGWLLTGWIVLKTAQYRKLQLQRKSNQCGDAAHIQ